MENKETDSTRNGSEIVAATAAICMMLLAACGVALLAYAIFGNGHSNTGNQQAVRNSAIQEKFFSSLKPGDFYTAISDGVTNCRRFAQYTRFSDDMLIVTTRDFDDSLSADSLWALGKDDDTFKPSCSAAALAEYRKYQAMDAAQKLAERKEKEYISFFHTLKKGDFFTETADKFGPAYCHEFIGISSSGAGDLEIAFKWQSDGSPFVESVLGTEYSFTRGCAKGSTRQ